jgi:hypothetical protein
VLGTDQASIATASGSSTARQFTEDHYQGWESLMYIAESHGGDTRSNGNSRNNCDDFP